MHTSTKALAAAFAAASAVSLTACGSTGSSAVKTGSSSSGAGCSGSAQSGHVTVMIHNYMFMPMCLKIMPGTTVTWMNMDSVDHTATDSGVFNTGDLGTGKTYSFTFKTAGQFNYICSIHNFMKAEIDVQ
jgi:plastocyanin